MKAITKKVRFEVFKRDKFTCQYCGRNAPDVILHVDHIHPKSKGGANNPLNLITSCVDCNLGKSDRTLADDSVVAKQRAQLEALQERREQIDMMLDWHNGLAELQDDIVARLAEYWVDNAPGWDLNENGLKTVKSWTRKFSVEELLYAIDAATNQYLHIDDEGNATAVSWEKAFAMVPKICNAERRCKEKPYLRDLYRMRSRMKYRFGYINEWECLDIMESAVVRGATIEMIKSATATSKTWAGFCHDMSALIEALTEENEDG